MVIILRLVRKRNPVTEQKGDGGKTCFASVTCETVWRVVAGQKDLQGDNERKLGEASSRFPTVEESGGGGVVQFVPL